MAEFGKADPQLIEDVALHATLKVRTRVLNTRRIIGGLRQSTGNAELIDGAADFLDGVLQSR
jgi:hypothetical protein